MKIKIEVNLRISLLTKKTNWPTGWLKFWIFVYVIVCIIINIFISIFFLDPESLSDADRRPNRLNSLPEYCDNDYDNNGCEIEDTTVGPQVTIEDYKAYTDKYPNITTEVGAVVCVGNIICDGY